jgi:hypothetical protein
MNVILGRKSIRTDGIDTNEKFVERTALLNLIIATADANQHVVLASPPATGKTSLLALVENALSRMPNEGPVLVFAPRKTGNAKMILDRLEHTYNIPTSGDLAALKYVSRTWIIIDDAQRAYTDEYEDLWNFLVKDLRKNPNIKVIIAATHNITTLGSPASISNLPHVFENFNESEVSQLIQLFCSRYTSEGWANWNEFWVMVKELSSLGDGKFHVGVVVQSLLLLESSEKNQQVQIVEEEAMRLLHKSRFLGSLDRCFPVDANMISNREVRESLTSVLVGEGSDSVPQALHPFVRGGVLGTHGSFACQAALWYYNTLYFPGRSSVMPVSLENLIEKAVASLSTLQLEACQQDNLFPTETAFQHLFNEAMNLHLPTNAAVKPEYRTRVKGFGGGEKRGFVDFYINDHVQWAVELLRLGDRLKLHLDRFHPITGTYRKLRTKKYLVVDLRGPKENHTVPARPDLCVLYFSAQWDKCVVQMRRDWEREVQLQL